MLRRPKTRQLDLAAKLMRSRNYVRTLSGLNASRHFLVSTRYSRQSLVEPNIDYVRISTRRRKISAVYAELSLGRA